MRRTALLGVIAGLLTVWLAGDIQAKLATKRALAMANAQQVVGDLHKVKETLEKAKHDYDGHRAKAVGEVSAAIHALEHAGKHPTAAPGEKKAAKQATPTDEKKTTEENAPKEEKESQAESDQQLRGALSQLETIHKLLEKEGKESKAEHHHHAAKAVHKAIEELKFALKII